MYCSYCGSNKHIIDNCPKTYRGQINRRNIHCVYCGSNKHNVTVCPHTFQGNGNMSPWNRHKFEKEYIKD